MKTLKYLLATMLLLGVCSLTHSQKLSLGIFPEPQEVTISSQTYAPSHGYTLRGINNPDADAVKLLKEALPFAKSGKSLPLEIKKLKDKTPEMQRSGAYTLTITKKGITIGIVDDNSLFYAAQTLKQLAKYDEGKKILPLCSIKDYPDVLFRGTVEGFYGQPWSHADRIEQIRFYGRIKLNTYIYGPKDDPYHSSPNWRKPYPAEEAEHIKELAKEAAHNKVNFVWAIHPGQDIQWNLTDSMNILSKFEKMYDLGVRSFAVFFDDISGEGARPEKQAGLLNYIHKEFISKKNDVQPLIMCPTEYNRSWAKTDYLDILGTQLDPAIQIMWTGDRVVADITKEGVEWVNNRIRRPAYIWWNFPVSDYCQDHLLMGPAYGLDTQAAGTMTGFVSNPMEYAEASKVAIFGVGMYTWNIENYDPTQAWKDACDFIMPEASMAFRIFCEHNCDPGPNGHQYRREESANYVAPIQTFLAGYKKNTFPEQSANLLGTLFAQITASPSMIYSQSPNKRLIEQINPWLIQFEFLGKAGTSALHMAHAWYEKDRSYTWQRYLETSALLDSMKQINRTLNQKAQPKGVKVGSKVLHPFIVDLYRKTGRNLLSTDGIAPDEVKVSIPSIFTNIDQLKSQPCAEGDNTVGYVPLFEVVKVQPNQYLGIGWEIQKEAESFCFNLPKSNQPGRVFEWSADGKSWSLIPHVSTENAKDTIRTIDPKARYIRMRNNSDQQMELYVLGFTATTQQDPQINEALMMYDMNLDTYKNLNPGEIIHIKCDDINAVSFFLSGSNENLVSITGLSQDGEKNIVYQGNVGYIKLNKTMFEDFSSLEITTIGKESIHIHQIVRE